MSSVEQKFHEKRFYQPLFPGMWFNQRELSLPEGCNYAYKMLNDAHKLHAIEIYLQCFQQTLENNALLELFCPAFWFLFIFNIFISFCCCNIA